MTRSVLGLDIGGANLKAVHSTGQVLLQPFELWKNPAGLPRALKALVGAFPSFDRLAVTMTGELCDCFASKRQGVHAILDAVDQVAKSDLVRVWRTDGQLTDVAAARAQPLLTAAANWLALAQYAGRHVPAGPGVVIDVGSTTTDIVPLLDGKPVPRGRTDPERLRCRELVYTGVRRTPVCALLGGDGAAELFATTQDVYLQLGQIAEDPSDHATADGRPATRSAARARLARMLCADAETCSAEEVDRLARLIQGRQIQLIRQALRTVAQEAGWWGRGATVVLAGSGEFLARSALERHPSVPTAGIISLSAELGPATAQAACAYALAQLAAEDG